MKLLMVAIVVIIAGFLIWNSKQKLDPAEQACARDIAKLFKATPDVPPQAIADVLIEHQITRERAPHVGRMVMPQLRNSGLVPEDAMLAMGRVKSAYTLVP